MYKVTGSLPMEDKMKGLKEKLHGIYGIDGLSCGLILLSVVLNLATSVASSPATNKWNIVCLLPLIICVLRMFSRNFAQREKENQVFLRLLSPLLSRFEGDTAQKEEKKLFKFFKCPACTQKIRVPKGKGRVEITCPRCGNKFIKKT